MASPQGTLADAIKSELKRFTGADEARLVTPEEAGSPPVADALTTDLAIRLDGEEARRLGSELGFANGSTALLLPMRPDKVLVLAGERIRDLPHERVEAAAALLNIMRVAREDERHAALTRAAKALNESLDLGSVLPRICEEAQSILAAEAVAVFRGEGGKPLVLEAAHPPKADTDTGVATEAIREGRPITRPTELAVPLRWDGQARGVLWARTEKPATDGDLPLLEGFAELAAVACRNASVHAGLAEAARTDGLTGCLNHAALHETLRREMQRSRRTGRRLSIVLVDLDHFKQVNERHGHLVGDEVLRRVGRALREAVRPYDFVARYGGDEFAIVAVDAHTQRAAEIGERAIARLRRALDGLLKDDGVEDRPAATAGVAEWKGDVSPSDLVREADRALLYGKQQGIRGAAVLARDVPENFALGRPWGEDEQPLPKGDATVWPSAVRDQTEPLRKRAGKLSQAAQLGARLAGLTRADEIFAVALDELHRALGFDEAAIVEVSGTGALEAIVASGRRPWRELRATDAVERCLVERQAVLVEATPRTSLKRSHEVGAEIAVPITVGDRLFGALDVQEPRAGALDDADVRLLETVAEQIGSALRAAQLFERLERAYLATAEALGAALESKDAHTAEHARSIVRNAEAVGRRLGMSPDELRDLRYAAAFHDIGKVAVPDQILNKPGPLTEAERRAVERHAELGAEILADVDFLEGVLPLVRHAHEHWDGGGYPDGLKGDRIPLGARVLLVCDAHDAMTADRPYRRALAPDKARAEIEAAVGRQFDSRVASAFLEAVAGGHGTPHL